MTYILCALRGGQENRGNLERQPFGSSTASAKFEFDVCVVGGCGHVGLALAIVLAHGGRDYRRMAGLPKSGFAAGPRLFKDTMQLAAATESRFSLRSSGPMCSYSGHRTATIGRW